ncbi:YjcZ family sporulation protein [Sporosarcina sp. ACRSM]|uniref:YjcZ family sporulation protein n=1 Tax=Sporosarcina sp. ACRSM TaxID=2918216 RepID=UPI001EF5D819|nr:YjcZ family sporulation protein [Sporosarcina sp. ACRSM]MCG7334264.1 YjcZ family sporulation protein [Sporosarcina sp. ACRSM]
MWGCYPSGCGYESGFVGGYGGFDGGRGCNYGGSTFVLIVVLFILLIIVGKSFC